MKKYFFIVLTKHISMQKLQKDINSLSSNQETVKCYDYEGGGIYIETSENPVALMHKLERTLNISFKNPIAIE